MKYDDIVTRTHIFIRAIKRKVVMSHNESLAEQVAEQASTNGNGVLNDGETGVKFAKDEAGMKFGVRFTNKQLLVGVAALTVGVILKRYGASSLAAKSASKIQDVAEQAEEAANRG